MSDRPFPTFDQIAQAVAQEFFVSVETIRDGRARLAPLPRRAFALVAQSLTPYGGFRIGQFLGLDRGKFNALERDAQRLYDETPAFRRRLLAIQAEILAPVAATDLDRQIFEQTLAGEDLVDQIEPETLAALARDRATLAAAIAIVARYAAGADVDSGRSIKALRLGANLAAIGRRIEREAHLAKVVGAGT